MNNWNEILDYIIDEGTDFHLWYSRELGWCYITDRNGNRHRVNSGDSFEAIKFLVEKVKSISSNSYANNSF